MSVDVAKARAELEWAQSMANYESWAQTYGQALCNDLAAAEARAEQIETPARALVEVAYSEEGDMGVRWYAVDAEYVDALAKVLGIEQPGDLGGEDAARRAPELEGEK